MIVIDDVAMERQIRNVSEWYEMTPTEWVQVQVQKAIDQLIDDVPNLATLIQLT